MEIGRVTDVGWALLPVSGEPVGQEWPTYDSINSPLGSDWRNGCSSRVLNAFEQPA